MNRQILPSVTLTKGFGYLWDHICRVYTPQHAHVGSENRRPYLHHFCTKNLKSSHSIAGGLAYEYLSQGPSYCMLFVSELLRAGSCETKMKESVEVFFISKLITIHDIFKKKRRTFCDRKLHFPLSV